MKSILLFSTFLGLPSLAQAATCEELTLSFSKYDLAATILERKSSSDDSTLRATTYQVAVSNILRRQGLVLDVMIAQECDLPAIPDFPMFGLITSFN